MSVSDEIEKPVKVSIFYDIPGWAFENVARNVQKISRAPYVIDIYCHEDWFGAPDTLKDVLRNSDVAVFLWRFDLLAFLDCLDDAGWARLMRVPRCAFVTLVYDHIYTDKIDLEVMGNPFAVADCVGASSLRLCRLYKRSEHLPDISHCVPDGVDLREFPAPLPDVPVTDIPLRIGWVGNSEWGITLGHDFKGRRTIFEPAMELLKRSGLPFTVHVADKAERQLPRDAMPDFFANIDVLICCSVFEGTPNPVLEAMASGCAVISTDVGIVPDLFGPKQAQFIMPERSPQSLANLLERLIHEPETLSALKQENIARRATLDWQTRWPAWQALFEEARANVVTKLATGQAIAAFRARHKSPFERIRKVIATNSLAFNAYRLLRARCPALIRWGKAALSGGRR